MSSITLTNLIANVRNRSEYSINFIPDADLITFLNASIAKVSELGGQSDSSRFTSTSALTTVSGTNYYSITCRSLVDVMHDNITLSRFNWSDRYDITTNAYYPGYYDGHGKYQYNFRGSLLWLYPTPTTVDIIYYSYVPEETALSDGTDTWIAPVTWQEYVLYDTLCKCAMKAGDDHRAYRAEMAQLEPLIRIAQVDTGSVATVGSKRRRRSLWR